MHGAGRPLVAARFVIGLVALAGAMLAVECFLRLAGYGQGMRFRRDPSWGYLMEPNQAVYTWGREIRINGLGLRGPDLTSPKARGVERVLFLGDSVTYGGGRIAEHELFVRVYERLERESGRRVEVANLSAPGWSPQNWQRWVERNGFVDADRLVLVLPECDLTRPFATLESYGFEREPPPLRVAFVVQRLADLLWPPVATAAVAGTRETVAANAAAVEGIHRGRSDRVLTVFVASASPSPDRRHWPRFEEAAATVLDLRGRLDSSRHYRDDIHLSPDGHLEVGRRIFAAIRAPVTGTGATAPQRTS